MKLKPRVLERTILKAVKTFPALVLTGPRQSGKTTLFKMLFSKTHTFVSLEEPDMRIRAKEDPVAFLNQYKPPVIIDEIQYFPELLSYIKTRIDENRKPGQWLLTGSQNFVLMHNVTQSLAGRAAVLSLLPFSICERIDNAPNALNISAWLKWLNIENKLQGKISLSEILLRGFYPEIACRKKVDRQLWCGSYITTYLERDVRNLATIGDLSQFERFLVVCATRTGQILNISQMARDIGISVPTAKRWLSILETGYQIYLLYPYYRNIGKRIVKSPKLYFNDPALCSYLLGLSDYRALVNGPSFGNLFETMVVCDFLKRFLHFGERPSMYYLRSRDGLEIDLAIEREGKLHLFEIKNTMTITSKHALGLIRMMNSLTADIETAAIISCSEENFVVKGSIINYGWKNVLGV
ncbi:MAG: ATP-binding protein [Caldiserica bacterium]|nr:ATP-binding protein [Caldisericota bacterium]